MHHRYSADDSIHGLFSYSFLHLKIIPYLVLIANAVSVVYVSYLLSPGRPPENSPVTFPYRNDTRRTPFDPMPDMLMNIPTSSCGISIDILVCENDGKSEESMAVTGSSLSVVNCLVWRASAAQISQCRWLY